MATWLMVESTLPSAGLVFQADQDLKGGLQRLLLALLGLIAQLDVTLVITAAQLGDGLLGALLGLGDEGALQLGDAQREALVLGLASTMACWMSLSCSASACWTSRSARSSASSRRLSVSSISVTFSARA
jgi:hypothetical protein